MQRMKTDCRFRLNGWKTLALTGCLAILMLAACPGELWACPNCKNAFRAGVERAYAASILFMLGMPFPLLGAWGVAIYRLLRRRV